MLKVSISLRLQAEADLLKSVTSGGSRTKVVAVGIGNSISTPELHDIASLIPHHRNVILVQDFGGLVYVEEELRNETCSGNLSSDVLTVRICRFICVRSAG